MKQLALVLLVVALLALVVTGLRVAGARVFLKVTLQTNDTVRVVGIPFTRQRAQTVLRGASRLGFTNVVIVAPLNAPLASILAARSTITNAGSTPFLVMPRFPPAQ